MKKTILALLCSTLVVHAAVETSALQTQPMMLKQETALTKEQRAKLEAPLLKEENGVYRVEVYSKLTFAKRIMFDEKSLNEIVIKQVATMKKGTINKEVFLAAGSTLSDQMIQSIFMNPIYMKELIQSENFIDQPMRMPDLTTELDLKADGINAKMYALKIRQEQFFPYATIFKKKLR